MNFSLLDFYIGRSGWEIALLQFSGDCGDCSLLKIGRWGSYSENSFDCFWVLGLRKLIKFRRHLDER